ncbi:YidB family protein [Halopseudomonas sp.]|uniref:YidB family protein n=1 Tax=Halopseudomonas sp. TaxID=2901191 RepID=UPI0030039919|tara:strand:- start:2870 stop:3283 length:414 start_codon:yes stop_codon:yes gene_type:complete
MSLLKTLAELFLKDLGSQGSSLDLNSVIGAMQKLLPTAGGEVNLTQLVGLFTQQGGGLASMAASWLGDGGNQTISASQIMSVLGQSNVAGFASQLGLNTDTAAQGLADVIPAVIDRNSAGGSFLGGAAASVLGKFLS